MPDMTETGTLREWVRSLQLSSVDHDVIAYASQLRRLYGGDEDTITAAALCANDPKKAFDALKDATDIAASAQQVTLLANVLLRLSESVEYPISPSDSVEERIVHDATLLAKLRRILSDPGRIVQAGNHLKELHFPASRQQAARDYALMYALAEHVARPPELEALTLHGNYIVFEGIDGTGKNAQAERLMARLREAGRKVVYHEEPTPRLGQMQAAFDAPSPTVELFLYTADRIEATGAIVRPALEEGSDVVSVRSFVSTLAYQSERYSPAEIAVISRHAPMPSLILLLDAPPEVGLKRVAQRNQPTTKYEKIERLTKARERYHDVLALFPQAVVIDAAPSIDDVADLIWETVRSQLMF